MLKGQKVLFSSLTDDWRTPKSLYDKLDAEFHFDFDPCPLNGQLGFFQEWGQRNFVNPPYSQVAKWIEHGWREAQRGKLCVFLVASRTDTRWFHNYCLADPENPERFHASEIRFIKGRLSFSSHDGKHGHAPFPSVIVIFDGR